MMRTLSILLCLTGTVAVAAAQPADAPPAPPPSDRPAPVSEPPASPPPAVPAPELPPVPAVVVSEPAPASADAKPKVAVTYDKGLTFKSADGAFALKLGFRNQVRFESLRPTEDKSQFVSHFSIPRSRMQVEGNVYGPGTRYKVEFSLGDAGSFAFLRDLVLDQQLGHAKVWLRAGQWKRPFNRQELVSDFASELNERANTAAFAGGGRDMGVALHNDYEKSPDGLEWVLGVFNGFSGGAERPSLATTCTQGAMAITCTTPTPSNFPADFGPAIVARAGWNTGGIKGYSEGDLEGGPLRLALGVSYKIDLANLYKGKEATYADNLSHGLEADAMLKVHGFALELGAYVMKLKTADAQLGALIQPGMFLVPKKLQLAGRFAYVPVAKRKQVEVRAAVNYYMQGHAWKLATDVGFVQLTGEDPMTMTKDKPDLQLRTMLQLTL